MKDIEGQLGQSFVCAKCRQHGAQVAKLAMSGTGITRFFDVQPYRYAFVSCKNCGYTEVYNLKILAGKDNPGKILETLFVD